MSRKIYIIIAVVLTVVLSVSTFFIIRNHIDSAKQNEVYDNLAEIVEDEPPKENEGVTFSEDKDYLAEYLELYRQNEDMVGWIKVEDTNINYPVVQSVNEPNFYLKHKFDKTYSAYGCPYVQENCDVQKPSDNIIIYGHHMNDGSMFTGLMKYRNKSFWEEHKANLPPRAMMGIEFCGMLLSAIHEEEGEEKLHLLMVDNHIPAGAKLY